MSNAEFWFAAGSNIRDRIAGLRGGASPLLRRTADLQDLTSNGSTNPETSRTVLPSKNHDRNLEIQRNVVGDYCLPQLRLIAKFMKNIRLLHLYLGTLIAPSLLFFALSGAIQTLGLHEGKRGGSYQPATWVKVLAQIHKHQTFEVPERKFPHPNTPEMESAKSKLKAPRAAEAVEKNELPHHHRSPWPLKIFFVFVCFGLALTTLLGIYMSFKFNRNKRLVFALLVLGVILPVVLAFF
ncbi:MAG: hypothetical protein ACYC46_13850 [Acidobacteriaceae bacterium]